MELTEVIARILNPGLAMLPLAMDSLKARVQLLAMTLQEDPRQLRRQMGNGPARGLWQFESGGGVKGVMNHHATTGHAHRLCAERGVPWDAWAIWAKLETDDLLACGFARLLLYSDPKPLPAVNDADGGWDLYMRTWRPGRPHPEKWPGNHATARRAMGVLDHG
ncbi:MULTISPECIES: hypothetical protein [unclassified Variovorax]|uniref:hypothetical protein n=1 Tax=unclassified Variovorax TaxID=663243 RepID=UPI000838FD11|nr:MULTISPECIES: hypothetical protein [unclassified Variovorax]PNG53165.1 hypothetical protein CHC06_04510 [Variovorax sp. B2]PNG53737.1 hypothetical protein CHC07_03557 [Variovorax sp. B4]VTV11188.1 hypothetical protein WDL1CHR_02071 [Variovorax sp. WDL1]